MSELSQINVNITEGHYAGSISQKTQKQNDQMILSGDSSLF